MVDTRDLKSLEPKGSCRFESGSEYNVMILKNGGTDAKNEMETFEARIKKWIRHKPHSHYINWGYSSVG